MCVWEISLKYPFSFTARSLFSFNKRSGILSLHIRTIFFFNFHCLRQQKRIFLREIYLWWKQLQMIKMWWGKINQAILFAYLCVELTMLLSKSWNGKYLIPYFYDNVKTNIKKKLSPLLIAREPWTAYRFSSPLCIFFSLSEQSHIPLWLGCPSIFFIPNRHCHGIILMWFT